VAQVILLEQHSIERATYVLCCFYDLLDSLTADCYSQNLAPENSGYCLRRETTVVAARLEEPAFVALLAT